MDSSLCLGHNSLRLKMVFTVLKVLVDEQLGKQLLDDLQGRLLLEVVGLEIGCRQKFVKLAFVLLGSRTAQQHFDVDRFAQLLLPSLSFYLSNAHLRV